MSEWTPDLLKVHYDAQLESLKEGVKVALDAANEKSKSHNDILGAMREQQAAFVTKEQVRWTCMALIGGIAVALAIFAAVTGGS